MIGGHTSYLCDFHLGDRLTVGNDCEGLEHDLAQNLPPRLFCDANQGVVKLPLCAELPGILEAEQLYPAIRFRISRREPFGRSLCFRCRTFQRRCQQTGLNRFPHGKEHCLYHCLLSLHLCLCHAPSSTR